jgi:hypothetical protein
MQVMQVLQAWNIKDPLLGGARGGFLKAGIGGSNRRSGNSTICILPAVASENYEK